MFSSQFHHSTASHLFTHASLVFPLVFQRVTARVDFSKFNVLLETSPNALKVIKNEAKLECSSSPNSNEYFLAGTFDQINTAHNLLRGILKGSSLQLSI